MLDHQTPSPLASGLKSDALQLEEVFFSRTNERGILQFGNSAFCRVSGFTLDELVGSPHRIVRHPDMPKAVFYLLWEALKAGETLGAYVKNKIKGGGSYWVFAIAMPCPDGFLSARIKPSSELLSKIKTLYAKIRTQEEQDKITPQESAQNL